MKNSRDTQYKATVVPIPDDDPREESDESDQTRIEELCSVDDPRVLDPEDQRARTIALTAPDVIDDFSGGGHLTASFIGARLDDTEEIDVQYEDVHCVMEHMTEIGGYHIGFSDNIGRPNKLLFSEPILERLAEIATDDEPDDTESDIITDIPENDIQMRIECSSIGCDTDLTEVGGIRYNFEYDDLNKPTPHLCVECHVNTDDGFYGGRLTPESVSAEEYTTIAAEYFIQQAHERDS